MVELTEQQRLYFRDELRAARAGALLDSEDFAAILFVLERLGAFLAGKQNDGLGSYKHELINLANRSPLHLLDSELHGWNPPFNRLLGQLIQARNDALHQGAFARHLTTHAIQISLILEDALMDGSDKVGDYMITNVVTASQWQPLSFIRQQMLVNSFSYLPILNNNGEPTGELISDCSLAIYLRLSRKERLAERLCVAMETHREIAIPTLTCRANSKIHDVLNQSMLKDRSPLLVVSEDNKRLVGIVTAFDLL